jgi:hypothetical protein
MNLISRILVGFFVVFLASVPGATAQMALADGGLGHGGSFKPSGLAVVSTTSSSVGISWNASALDVSYGVYLGGKRVASTTATTYTFTGLTCEKSYRMGVDAVRAADKRSAKAWVSATTLACPSPPPPPPPPPHAAASVPTVEADNPSTAARRKSSARESRPAAASSARCSS